MDVPKIIFVTGKGGTGKSTVAASLAWRAALSGRKTLLVELSPDSRLTGMDLPKNLTTEVLTGTSSLKSFVKYYIRIPGLADLFFENRVMRTFLNVAPALNELAILGKITSGERRAGPAIHYDLIVVDTFATGHALALFRAPEGMSRAVKSGPMGKDSRAIFNVLSDSKIVRFMIVTLPEDLPVDESVELREQLKKIFPQQEPQVVVNKVELEGWSTAELQEAERDSAGQEKLWARYLLQHKKMSQSVLDRLDREFSGYQRAPLVFSSDYRKVIEKVGESLWTF